MHVSHVNIKTFLTTALALLLSCVLAVPSSFAYSGTENQPLGSAKGNGIVWGVGAEGSYNMTEASGKNTQGFCIDPGLAYPGQQIDGAQGSKYTGPVDWDFANTLSDKDKAALTASVLVGKALDEGQGGLAHDTLKKLGLGTNMDALAAGASGHAHRIGSMDPARKGEPGIKDWNENSLEGDGKAAYDAISNIPAEAMKPLQDLGTIKYKVYIPEDGKRQRMLTADFELKETPNIPSVSIPNVSIPSASLPSGSRTTGKSSTSKPTSGTKPTSSSKPTSSVAPENKGPQIRTNAKGKDSNKVEMGGTIIDVVSYEGLKPNSEYTLNATAVEKETGRTTRNVGYNTFVPQTASGTVEVQIPITDDESDQLVIFESLTSLENGGRLVAEHKDQNDQAQTVGGQDPDNESTPEIRTSAESSTGNKIQSGTMVNDTVSYQGLVPGDEYRLEAQLMCKADGSDTGAIQTQNFTPAQASGQEVVTDIAVTNPDCAEQVAFEKLYDKDGFLVASHEEITDAAQTIGGETSAKKVAPAAPGAPAPEPAQPQSQAPRQVIASVPSGATEDRGSTIFTR